MKFRDSKTLMMKYPVVIHKDDQSDFGVIVPDLPGCFSAGASEVDALVCATEAAECHIEGLLMDGEPIPEPSAFSSDLQNEFDPERSGIWALIDVDLSKLSGKSRRVNITVLEHILAQIDTYASQTGTTRSRFLADAAMHYVLTNPVSSIPSKKRSEKNVAKAS